MKKVCCIFCIAVAVLFDACSSKTPNPLQAEVTALTQTLTQKQDSLEMYKKLPFVKIPNPLNKSEVVLLKDPQSWVAFDSTLKQIEKAAQELLARELKTDETNHWYLRSEINIQKEQKLISDFKRKNAAFCKRWAYDMLNNELGAENQSEENFEENPALVKLRTTIEALPSDSTFSVAWDKVENLKNLDIKNAWETFKKKN